MGFEVTMKPNLQAIFISQERASDEIKTLREIRVGAVSF